MAATGLQQLLDQYERGELPYEKLAAAMNDIALTQRPRGKTLAEDHHIAETARDDNDLFYLDSARNRRVISADQHRDLVGRTRTPTLPGISTPL